MLRHADKLGSRTSQAPFSGEEQFGGHQSSAKWSRRRLTRDCARLQPTASHRRHLHRMRRRPRRRRREGRCVIAGCCQSFQAATSRPTASFQPSDRESSATATAIGAGQPSNDCPATPTISPFPVGVVRPPARPLLAGDIKFRSSDAHQQQRRLQLFRLPPPYRARPRCGRSQPSRCQEATGMRELPAAQGQMRGRG